MEKRTRQAIYLIGVMLVLSMVVLFLYVYAPDPVKRPKIDWIELFKSVFKAFNIFNYL
ncbi:MAG: hypothetical protein ABEJ83_05250 [Candidatus Nanohaloarchaea archaeon]